nr:PEP/pyruvate-binding domain-containing protein [Desulfonema magnum]
MQSKALEANLASYHVEVTIDSKYLVLQDIMSGYYGIMEGLNTFLAELSHPHKNWQFIVKEARKYSLDYLHLFRKHPKGNDAARLFVDIFINAIEEANTDTDVKSDAADNLLLFLEHIIKEAGTEIEKFIQLTDESFDRIRMLDDSHFFLFVKSFYQIKKLTKALFTAVSNPQLSGFGLRSSVLLLVKYYKHTYAYWLNQEDPWQWFEEEAENGLKPLTPEARKTLNEFFKNISHEQISKWNSKILNFESQISDIRYQIPNPKSLEFPGYNQIVEVYRDMPGRLLDAGGRNGQGKGWKVIFLFHIMSISGLSMIHEEALRDINRTLSWLISHERHLNIEKIIRKTFSILKERIAEFPTTALNCVLNMGKGVSETDESDLINLFINSVIDLGFQSPMIRGVGNDWQIKVNTAHLQNIKIWLQLIELNPKYSTRLLSYLIIHLSLCGVFIRDTDLFPRDVTRLLNSDIKPVYNLVKQLAKLFPVYFNDIGAEGKLRDISTQIDEISHRKDILIHFLRKQIHVESSNRIIGFMEAVFYFWISGEKKPLESFVPPSIYEQIDSNGPYTEGIHKILSCLDEKIPGLPEGFLTIKQEELKNLFKDIEDVSDEDLERAELAVSLYKLLCQKYDLVSYSKIGTEPENYFSLPRSEAFPAMNKLKDALAEAARPKVSFKRTILKLLNYLELLKNLILSPQSYEIREDIYKKRHFTVDIPSMYGSYHEMKFDALGLTFRIEALVNVLFEELNENIDLSLITKATSHEIFARLSLFNRALKLDGISTVEIERQLDFLAHSIEVRGFTFTQYLDIFKGFARAVKNIINDYFNNIHEENLTRILSRIPAEEILPKYLPRNDNQLSEADEESLPISEKMRHRVSEIFSREKIAHSLGLQQLDVFLSRILSTLFRQADKLPDDQLQQLLIYDPQSAMMLIDHEAASTGIIYLGNKGLNLIKLQNYGLPVPPGFIITTEVFRFRKMIENYRPAERNFREQVAKQISLLEKITGKKFGYPANPLLFSVRSGSSISQPGMMDTFLNVGINEKITAGLAAQTGNPWFAWDNYRRFLQCYGMSYDLKRDDFDAIISEFKKKLGIPYKRGFTGEQMKTVAMAYKEMIRAWGLEITEEPFEQLLTTIKKVFNSWESSKAKTYRKIIGISDDWGTAVTVQSMVFGNLSRQSGTGVIFTHNPRWSGEVLRLWGDFTIGNQGEDVVAGLVTTLPISIFQQDIEMRDTDTTLESHFPEIYEALKAWANKLIYKKGWSPQEMEFTFESPSVKDLYLLQTRDMAIRERKKVFTFDPDEIAVKRALGNGVGVSGGAMSGRAVFTLEDIGIWRVLEPETSLILLRGDTVPDDIREIHAADGLLTARGGLTSHAAVVAHNLGKTCVVGCRKLVCNEKEKTGFLGDIIIKTGDYISINGREGSVYEGLMKVRTKN